MKNTESKTLTGNGFVNVERYFSNCADISYEGILKHLIQEKIDKNVKKSYNCDQVNVATSGEGVA